MLGLLLGELDLAGGSDDLDDIAGNDEIDYRMADFSVYPMFN
jgi:hypothetical protein